MAEVQCPSCGRLAPEETIYNDSQDSYCVHCSYRYYKRYCPKCKTYKANTFNWEIDTSNKNICKDCSSRMIKCSMCSKVSDQCYITEDGQELCLACKERYLFPCDDCGKETWKTDLVRITTTKAICQSCYRKKYVHCSRCNNVLLQSEAKKDPITSYYFCPLCFKVKNIKIHSHSYKPIWRKFGKANTYFGVELEVECKDIDKTLAVCNVEHGDRIIKKDGSLNKGFEIVSAPCSLIYHKQKFGWRKLCKALKAVGCKADDTTTCGLHVHITRHFSKAEELRISTFVYTHLVFLKKLARRIENQYAKLPYDIWSRLNKQEVEGERYELINWTNTDTVEFRLPKGTINYKNVLATIELCDAIIHYIKSKTIQQIKKEPTEVFLSWLEDSRANRSRYAHLLRYCYDNIGDIKRPIVRRKRRTKGATKSRTIRREPISSEAVPQVGQPIDFTITTGTSYQSSTPWITATTNTSSSILVISDPEDFTVSS